ncbi:MAG: lysine--tRNA ligase [Spirochaetales bacterium]|jgi:lysyl-tRNA synthetase class 1|nr:lysine--tRNA ligase [Spirochaetales bacterium]
MAENDQGLAHWADINAAKIIREKGEKDVYTCASGITPSGTVHIGNFREIISVDLVARALKKMGKKVRFIYSWDDYDVFRKVPKNMPQQEMLERHLRWPITLVPDPWGRDESYARHHEVDVEQELHRVGIEPEYLYQTRRYRGSVYARQIRTALSRRAEIRAILDAHRTEPLPAGWFPVSVFCGACSKDTTTVLSWDGDYSLEYRCDSCGRSETVDLLGTSLVKLPWRVDWPMRWAYEGVDFEPAGKDHHSEGGSFDTAREVVRRVFEHEPPVSFQYDFISIKGRGGKISSSSGDVIDLKDVLEVYTPEVTRYLFAGTRPNTEFSISFDLDVIKIYEDYDKTERIYFGAEACDEKKREKEKRIYELSQTAGVPELMPCQAPFRHLCNLLQINSGDVEKTLDALPGLRPEQRDRLRARAECAWRWITGFAPEDFRFSLRGAGEEPAAVSDAARAAIRELCALIDTGFASLDEKTLGEAVYAACAGAGIEPRAFFPEIYRALIGKDKGPRLAAFILSAGRERIVEILKGY